MLTFYRPSNKRSELTAVVWNPRANAVLADFSQGNKFQTDDPYVIQKLRELGYPTVEEYEGKVEPPAPPDPPRPRELKPQAVATKPVVHVRGKSPVVKKGAAPVLKKRPVAPQGPGDMDTDEVSPSKR